MRQFIMEQLITAIPYSIRMELLKQQLIEIYTYEAKIMDTLKRNGVDFYNVGSWTQNDIISQYSYDFDRIYEQSNKFIVAIKNANLPDEMIVELYQWAKNKRNEMNLRDNLFNLFEGCIQHYRIYEHLNEELNGRKVL